MPVISTVTDTRYWIVTDSDALPDGTFDINLKQVLDYQATPVPLRPAPRRTINRPNDVPRGTIVKVTDVTSVDRTLTVNPTS